MRAPASILVSALLLLPLGGAGAEPEAGGAAAQAPAGVSDAATETVDVAAVAPTARGVTPVAYEAVAAGTVRIPSGEHTPLYGIEGDPVGIASFALDRRPVTRAEFGVFLADHPEWRRDRVKGVFADDGYLASWPAADDFGSAVDGARPATEVSWFAARAYCEARGQRLPTVDEWEYAAALAPAGTSGEAWKGVVLSATNRRTRGVPGPVGTGLEGGRGLRDMHGLVHEWVMDFNTVVVSSDSRGTGARDRGLYCASGARGASDVSDYAAFLRYGFRASLDGRSTTANLGFRCAGG